MSSTETVSFTGTGEIGSFIEARKEPSWMRELRRQAHERFESGEWPTKQDEEWRRSDISSYDFDAYSFTGDDVVEPRKLELPDAIAGEIHFQDSVCTGVSLKPELAEKGVLFASLGALLAADGNGTGDSGESHAAAVNHIQTLLQQTIDNTENRIYDWHYSTWTHGVVLYVPRFVEISEPFLITMNEGGEERLSVPQIIVALDDGARATVIQRIKGTEEDGEVIVNDGVDMFVGAGGQLDYLALHDLNIDSSTFSNSTGRVERDAHLHHFTNLLGGMFSKVRTDVHLNGTGADVRLDGLYFGYEDQHMDLRTVQYHKAKNANSRTFYKGAVKDESHSVYQGLIAVDHGCDQTDAYLTNNNLILNDGARADSIPTLQIHTDDVKCSHGSTTGKIDSMQLFYLTSRGIPLAEAKLLLVQGFFEENIERAPELLQEELRDRIAERMLAEQDED